MRQAQLFAKTKKAVPQEVEAISHQLLLRGDFIEQLAAGVYSFLPLGFRVLKKIEAIIREEMEQVGGQEVFLPTLIPKSLWQKTGRWEEIDPPLFRVKDRHKKEYGLGSTHEEVITELARTRLHSYKDLPQALFQIQNKFRNEMRPTSGLLRTREFLMKDLYSFHATKEEARVFYEKIKKAYTQIFKRCSLEVLCVEADPGTIGGSLSHEFMTLSETGEDKVMRCKVCGFSGKEEKLGKSRACPGCEKDLKQERCIEVGHTFYLGKKYSEVLEASYVDEKGARQPIIMGCYGIGLGRLLATVVEVQHDKKGMIWPKAIAPFTCHLVQLEESAAVKRVAEKLYRDLQEAGLDPLYDDREDKSAGEKLIDADLIGLPCRVVVSEKTLKKESCEIKRRGEEKERLVKLDQLITFFKRRL